MKNFSDVKQRVLKYLEYKKISKNKFYNETGISNGVLDKSGGLTAETIEKIFSKYTNISLEWLITGNGSMLKNEEKDSSPTTTKEIYRLKTDNRVYDSQQIPLYNIEASAGIVTLFRDSQKNQPIDYIQIPNLPKCDGAIYVTGDSMYPLLKSGDIIMYKQIQNFIEGIYWGEMYLISIDQEGDELVLVKYIQKSEKGNEYIKLVSQNQHHQDKEVPLSRIKALALVKASVRINSMS